MEQERNSFKTGKSVENKKRTHPDKDGNERIGNVVYSRKATYPKFEELKQKVLDWKPPRDMTNSELVNKYTESVKFSYLFTTSFESEKNLFKNQLDELKKEITSRMDRK